MYLFFFDLFIHLFISSCFIHSFIHLFIFCSLIQLFTCFSIFIYSFTYSSISFFTYLLKYIDIMTLVVTVLALAFICLAWSTSSTKPIPKAWNQSPLAIIAQLASPSTALATKEHQPLLSPFRSCGSNSTALQKLYSARPRRRRPTSAQALEHLPRLVLPQNYPHYGYYSRFTSHVVGNIHIVGSLYICYSVIQISPLVLMATKTCLMENKPQFW